MCLMQYKNLKITQVKQYYKKTMNAIKKFQMEVNKILYYFVFLEFYKVINNNIQEIENEWLKEK